MQPIPPFRHFVGMQMNCALKSAIAYRMAATNSFFTPTLLTQPRKWTWAGFKPQTSHLRQDDDFRDIIIN